MRLITHALTAVVCHWIIWYGRILGWTVEEWHTVEQYSGTVKVERLFIGRYIQKILKKIVLPIPATVSVELLRYAVGSGNELHIDNIGPHHADNGLINAEWIQTGVILLNNNFEGGALIFPKQNAVFDQTSRGDLIIFPAGPNSNEFAHTVSTVTQGTRYSLVMRWSK